MVQTDERLVDDAPSRAVFSLDAFSAADWLLLAGAALTWGSSFLWIEIGLEAFSPLFIAFIRIVFGAATLALFRKARTKVDRKDMPAIALLGLLWMALPLALFPIAQQWIDSSLAGMINGGVPIFAAAIAAVIARRRPPAKTIAGIGIGFAGVVAVSSPAVQGTSATALGAGLALLATIMYGVSLNIAVPLQRKYGALPVLLRVQLVALGLTLIPGVTGATSSSFDMTSLLAMIPLGCLGTGLAFVWMATLVGRVGASRGSITIYFVPVIAILIGALVRSETISVVSLAGTALVLTGAFIASRTQRAAT